ncbi:MAG TPA: sugar transferase [Ilumatobacter sp.]|nr:sugar transferase [Ilumatobacter sp.]
MREMTHTPADDKEGVADSRPFPSPVERVVTGVGRPLGWLWSHGFRFLIVLDAVGLFLTILAINMARFGWDWPTYPRSHYWVGFAAATVIHIAVYYFAGLYEREPRLGYRPWLPRIVLATAIAIAFDALVAVVTDRYLMPRLNLAIFGVLATVGLTFNRNVSRRLANRRRGLSRVLLVGRDEAVDVAERHFATAHDAVVIGKSARTTELFDLVHRTQATDVLLLDLSAFESAFPEPLTALDREGVGVHQRVSAKETLLGLQSVREIAGMPFTRMRTHVMASHQLRLKRLFDLVCVIALAPLWVAAIGLLALYVKLVAGGPVFYRQTRVGLLGQHFTVVKFRTMVVDAERNGPRLSGRGDARVVPRLAWMRSTRADELPQLWNVLKGEMSLVGPRPERPELIAKIERQVPGYDRRHELPPGLTGFAQIHGRYDTSADHKLGYDLQYVVNWSLVLDVQILLRTVWVVLSRRV